MIGINNKFNIGEEVYTYYRKPISVDCPFCKGKKVIEYHAGLTIKCKNCYGTGVLKSATTLLEPCEVKINRIKGSIGKDSVNIKYVVSPKDINLNVKNRAETSIFKTREECQEYCNKVNNGEVTGEF